MMLRNYISAAEKFARENQVDKELEEWLAWARKKADWYDPFIESEDELLKGVDRNTLSMGKKPAGGW